MDRSPSSDGWSWQAAEERGAKRRKLRKGTHSCWDCKRRKIRCIFTSSSDTKCVNCTRRGTPCVGQDLPNTSSKQSQNVVDNKIMRVESMLEELSKRLTTDPQLAPATAGFTPVPISSHTDIVHEPRSPARSVSIVETPRIPEPRHGNASISEQLVAAFPAREDLEIVVREGTGSANYAHMMNNEQQTFMTREVYEAKKVSGDTTRIPGPSLHPVLLARQMLFWSIFLSYPLMPEMFPFKEHPRVISKRLVTAAIDLVTTKDDLHGSIESLECIMLESTYHTFNGNVRRAWLVNRRAMQLAQLMGIHRYPAQGLKQLDPEIAFCPTSMWYRIVFVDRYFSLLLGLPQGTTCRSMVTIPVPNNQTTDVRGFERSLSSIAAKILERNQHGIVCFGQDKAIDHALLQLSQTMPEDFWQMPSFQGIRQCTFEDAVTIEPFIAQVFYYQLLNQLHWPYMLRTIHSRNRVGANRHEDYSTLACANASREILRRFIGYRTFNHFATCFRLVDLSALTAALTLILTHLDLHLSSCSEKSPTMSRNILAHQRLSDRTLLKQAVEKLNIIDGYNHDSMDDKGAKLLNCLLGVELAAARGEAEFDMTDSVVEGQENASPHHILHIPIPYFGSVCVSRKGQISTNRCTSNRQSRPDMAPSIVMPTNASNSGPASTAGSTFDQDLSYLSTPAQTLDMLTPITMANSINDMINDDSPSITAGMSDWAFQGVDIAFFDSLAMNVPDPSNVDMFPGQGTGPAF